MRTSSSTDGDGNVLAVEDLSRSSLRINGGFFVLKRDVVDWIEPGDELVEETFARLIAAREVVAYPTRGSSARWTRSRIVSASSTCTNRVRRPGGGSRRPSTACRSPLGSLIGLSPTEPLRRVLVVGCHADDIEIGCGGTLLTLTRTQPGLEVDWVVLAARGDRGGGSARERRSVPRRRGRVHVEVHGFRDGFLPYVGAEVKEVFEGLKGRIDPTSCSRTPTTTSTRITGSPAS